MTMANTDKPHNIINSQYEKVPLSETVKEADGEVPASFGVGSRHVQALLVFMAVSVNLMTRAHLAVTVVAMLPPDGPPVTGSGNGSDDPTAAADPDAPLSLWNVYRTYRWDKAHQEAVLSAFFAGYALAMWPMGLVVQRLGGKRPLQLGLLASGLVSIATPWLAAWGGWRAVAASRALMGLMQSGTFPSATLLVARWVPAKERASLGTYVFVGSTVGTIVAFQLGGLLASSCWGWPATFWACGALCLAACTLLSVFGHRSPAHHPTISEGERNYIMGTVFKGKEKRVATPWRRLLASRAAWAAFVAQMGTSVVFLFMFTQVPSYLHFIVGVDVKSSGLLSSVPYVANVLAAVALGNASDYCTNRGLVSVRTARILANTLASVVPALCLVLLGYTRRAELAVAALALAQAAHAASHVSWMVNYIDLAPRFVAALMATGNALMNSAALGLPLLVARIVTDVHNPTQWRVVLFAVAGVSVASNAAFAAFMSARTQPWNEPETEPQQPQPESKEMEAYKESTKC